MCTDPSITSADFKESLQNLKKQKQKKISREQKNGSISLLYYEKPHEKKPKNIRLSKTSKKQKKQERKEGKKFFEVMSKFSYEKKNQNKHFSRLFCKRNEIFSIQLRKWEKFPIKLKY